MKYCLLPLDSASSILDPVGGPRLVRSEADVTSETACTYAPDKEFGWYDGYLTLQAVAYSASEQDVWTDQNPWTAPDPGTAQTQACASWTDYATIEGMTVTCDPVGGLPAVTIGWPASEDAQVYLFAPGDTYWKVQVSSDYSTSVDSIIAVGVDAARQVAASL